MMLLEDVGMSLDDCVVIRGVESRRRSLERLRRLPTTRGSQAVQRAAPREHRHLAADAHADVARARARRARHSYGEHDGAEARRLRAVAARSHAAHFRYRSGCLANTNRDEILSARSRFDSVERPSPKRSDVRELAPRPDAPQDSARRANKASENASSKSWRTRLSPSGLRPRPAEASSEQGPTPPCLRHEKASSTSWFIVVVVHRGLRPRPAEQLGTGPHPHRASGTRKPARRAGFISCVVHRGLRPRPAEASSNRAPPPPCLRHGDASDGAGFDTLGSSGGTEGAVVLTVDEPASGGGFWRSGQAA